MNGAPNLTNLALRNLTKSLALPGAFAKPARCLIEKLPKNVFFY